MPIRGNLQKSTSSGPPRLMSKYSLSEGQVAEQGPGVAEQGTGERLSQ